MAATRPWRERIICPTGVRAMKRCFRIKDCFTALISTCSFTFVEPIPNVCSADRGTLASLPSDSDTGPCPFQPSACPFQSSASVFESGVCVFKPGARPFEDGFFGADGKLLYLAFRRFTELKVALPTPHMLVCLFLPGSRRCRRESISLWLRARKSSWPLSPASARFSQ
jgi:hypothetical protein